MTLPLFRETRPEPIVLLHLNHTLAENSAERFGRRGCYADWIAAHERYRAWLVDLLRERTVLLVTARPTRYEAATMRRIAETCEGWQPTEGADRCLSRTRWVACWGAGEAGGGRRR
ncbi:hypothetical protein G6O69_19160 [Pseudenhygromyxa sp. WMMC2535]|uniref:hypothetical protein n=1 Tax=Pseudenhygromyxa sp. WMMC2535 TaxID=2712867 RepID=UPI0015958106|nr:hypothetical protein [Pseudenhygromyxa sp. WMMC2535]NVB39972.1 hypothetical protein [Pseudenhygromyxa sp. WMMC2535]